MTPPRQIVDPPSFTPLPYGLLTVVDFPAAVNGHWQNGIMYQSRCVDTDADALTYDECLVVTGTGGAVPAPEDLVGNVTGDVRVATPFTVYAEFDCSPVGNDDPESVAVDVLTRTESWQVERAFWTGDLGTFTGIFPHLAADATVLDASGVILQSPPVTGGSASTKISTGIGILEQELADCYNGVGVIHIPMKALPRVDAAGIVKAGTRLKTLNGNLIAVGAGYDGSAPDGSAPAAGTTWIYGTGAVIAYRGPVKVRATLGQSIDRQKNTVHMIAERTYVIGWECCHVGVLVSLEA